MTAKSMLSRRSVVIHEDDVGVHFTLTSERRPYRWRPLTTPFAFGWP